MNHTRNTIPNGKILKNSGTGWKLHGRVKAGITPQQAYDNAKARNAEFLAANPEEPWRAARRAAVEAYAPVLASGRRPADCYSDGWYDGWIAGRYGPK